MPGALYDRTPIASPQFRDTVAAANAAVHVSLKRGQDETGDRVPWRENWILFLLGLAPIAYFRYYEHYTLERALRRDYGLCSQLSIMLWAVLRRRGLRLEITKLDGHVVLAVTDPGSGATLLADPDYGHVIPASLAAVRADLSILDDVYGPDEGVGRTRLKAIFMAPARVEPGWLTECKRKFEQLAYAAKWAVPIALVATVLACVFRLS